MNRQDKLKILIRDFGLKSIDVQLLDLIPLIEVMTQPVGLSTRNRCG